MDNLNPGNNKNDYTIRIVDLIWYILSKWRSIVISMLIFALTVAALGYCMPIVCLPWVRGGRGGCL